MKEIETRKGEKIQVSDEHYDYLSGYTWHINNMGVVVRARLTDDPKHYPAGIVSMAREIFSCPHRRQRVTHRDKNKLNCQKDNLVLHPIKVGTATNPFQK